MRDSLISSRIDRVERERQEQLNRNNALQQHIAQQEADMGLLRLQNADGDRRFGELQTEFNALNEEIKALRTVGGTILKHPSINS